MLFQNKAFILFMFLTIWISFAFSGSEQTTHYVSPIDFEIDREEGLIYVAEFTSRKVRCITLENGKTEGEISFPLPPKAIAISGDKLITVCSYSEGELVISDLKKMKAEATIKVGHGAADVVVSPDGTRAYVANQFSDDISVVDLMTKKELLRIPVLRQPMVIEMTQDGEHLFVANFLTEKRADVDTVTSSVSIIHIQTGAVTKNIPLANGSNALRGICMSADGKYVLVSHNLGRFQVPTTQLEQGWMNTSALSVIDATQLEYVATVLLDDPEHGAAGSWGIDCTPEHILVAHSGTHDFSVINYPEFIKKLLNTEKKDILSYDLRFLSGIRERIPVSGNGPRVIKGNGSLVYVNNYFSDKIDVIDLDNPLLNNFKTIVLNSDLQNDSVRMGEIYFNDATYCFQGWQSCNGCHPNHCRTDGLNWDLMNDGLGNPKNCKSMLYAHVTPPSMITGIRPNAESAVRSGFQHIQFAQVEESQAIAVDLYLRSLEPVPSPKLENGELNPLAKEGEKVFEKLNCNECHPAPYYTDLNTYDLGQEGKFDKQNKWDTPTLIEIWRTGPYLHDGRSATLKEVFSVEKHGIWQDVSDDELTALTEYVLSL
jgi:YVTN family beta-propeller protein